MKCVSKSSIVAAVTLASMVATVAPAMASSRDDRSPVKSYEVSVSSRSQSETIKGGKSQGVKNSGWSDTTFFSLRDPAVAANSQYGHFTGQIHFGEKETFAWSFRLHPGTAAAARGMMSESARLYLNGRATGYKDTHPSIAANYLVHSSTKVQANKSYKLVIDEQFPIARRGTRHIRTEFKFIVHPI
ncbi:MULTISPECIES: hypothetical protein [Streptomyces]|uniref:Uncharacterized protein n=1 Tax=Streptomyces siderophoricus TaxID=2802281 RepID=A0ABS1N2L9_9ACTN|nr:hypothetical protein [Streptomyces sp. 9-7]MBL1094184.1 hypothetical protein [Streptomyces sp. 9-7]